MNKENIIQPIVEDAFNAVDFIIRYKAISDKFILRKGDFAYTIDNILNIAKQLGIPLKYSESKKFHIREKIDNLDLNWGFSIRFNSFELGFSVKDISLNIFSAAPWGFLSTLLSNNDFNNIPNPKFSSYDDIENIIDEAYSIHKDFKLELLKQMNDRK